MTKKQFLENLYEVLIGSLGKEEVYSHIRYYDEYIESEKRKGIREEEVVKGLGNPRYIAKTILDSSKIGNYSDSSYNTYENQEQPNIEKKSGIAKKIKNAFLIFVVCFLLFQLLRFGFWIFWKIGLPVLVVYLIYRLIKGLFG